MNIIVLGVSIKSGMAGTLRVKNLLFPLFQEKMINLSNLILVSSYEKVQIGNFGDFDGIEYKYIGIKNPLNPICFIEFYRTAFIFLKNIFSKEKKNILYCYGYPDLLNLLILLYAKILGFRIVFDITEDNSLADKNQFNGYLGWFRNKSSVFFVNHISKLGNGVIVISRYLEVIIRKRVSLSFPLKRIPVTFPKDNFELTDEYDTLNDGIVRFFYGGTFAPKDGVSEMIQAFKEISANNDSVKMILTGQGKPSDMEVITNLIKDNSKIEYLGYLNEDAYFSVLRKADICCMNRVNSAYANAGFPFKLAEYLAAGKAIVATEIGEVNFYLQNNINAILVQPNSVNAFVNAFNRLILNENNLRQNLGIAAKRTAFEYFDSKKNGYLLLDFFKTV